MGIYDNNVARSLLINTDSRGSNSSKGKLWKFELQELANETRLEITVLHFPRGTSKWNKIEHRLFSYISKNWRARPLIRYQVIKLISSTKQKLGSTLNVRSTRTITEQESRSVTIKCARSTYHGVRSMESGIIRSSRNNSQFIW